MKKLLIFLVMMSLMIMPMVIGAATMTLNQGVSIQVNEAIVVSITPDNLNFGLVTPSLTPSIGTDIITINATGSNIDLTISSSVEGQDVLFQGISFIDSVNPNVPIPINGILTTLPILNQVKTFGTQIMVPLGTVAGARTGTITYTITGPTP